MPQPTKCPVCGGNLVPGEVTHEEEHGSGVFYIFQNVPALVCEQCEEYLLSDDVVAKLERITETAEPVKRVETPIYDFANA